MFRAPTDSAVFRRYFTTQVLLPIGILVIAVVAAVALGLHWAAGTSNEVSLQRQTRMTRLALTSATDRVAYEQQSVAAWNQLSGELAKPRLDKPWIDAEIGQWLHEMFSHDLTFILDADGQLIYAYAGGRSKAADRFRRAQADLRPMIDAVRGISKSGVMPRQSHKAKTTALTRSETIYEGFVTEVDGRPAAASAMLISSQPAPVGRPEPILVSVRFLDGAYLQQIAAWAMIDGLRFSMEPKAHRGETMVAFSDKLGEKIGYFFWKPELPGTQIEKVLAPIAAFVILIMVGMMGLLARSLWRSGRQLSTAIVDLRASEAQAQHLAFHDVLTGLPNRAMFHDRLEQALARARRGHPCAILALDLDRFKQVNDTLGHAAGDTLIREFAQRLAEIVRTTDTVARIGGDEFSVLLCDADRRKDIEQLCDRVLATVREPFDLLGSKVFVGVSIGVVLVPEAGTDRGDLIRKADIALYRAKSEGRDRYRIFTPLMDETVKLRSEIEEELRHAIITGGELEVYYQPEVEAGTQRIVGMEALLRWNHPVRGMIPPDQFIPIAEETGLIVQLGEWVLSVACRMAQAWPDIFVAVNLSAVQFRSADLATRIIDIARAEGCDPARIELEITEGVLLDEDHIARGILQTLREAGFRIALDDFGTGYSSLSYLRQFKVDKIKIDRSFIQNLGHDHEAAAIVTSVVTLGHAMGLTVTAEGVESRNQMQLLHAAGCNELQGYLFSRALPAAAIVEILAGRQRLHDVA